MVFIFISCITDKKQNQSLENPTSQIKANEEIMDVATIELENEIFEDQFDEEIDINWSTDGAVITTVNGEIGFLTIFLNGLFNDS